MKFVVVVVLFVVVCGTAVGQWRAEGGITVSRFEQQVKSEVGGGVGEKLVEEFQFGFSASGVYSIVGGLSAGIFLRADIGERSVARFSLIDSTGKAVTTGELGGSYSEFWAGPLVQYTWKQLFAELGFGVIGIRGDDGRSDIPSSTGDTTPSFRTHPTIAWMFGVGGNIPVLDNLDVVLKLEYRIRYYDKRGGERLPLC
jgi:hypothetical protein